MKTPLKTVTRLPLAELWNEAGATCTARGGWLDESQVGELLGGGNVRFVIANVGKVLCWIAVGKSRAYWQTEVRHHLADPETGFRPEGFPGGYCFLASRWDWPDDTIPVVLLEMHH